jgi:hypothetical protein
MSFTIPASAASDHKLLDELPLASRREGDTSDGNIIKITKEFLVVITA